ncbi:MAG TPA: sulfite reductase, partial [Sporolactobacillaceae bacterium]|nr:sulfite reductase [Sporolactobacillaceae bacterium]
MYIGGGFSGERLNKLYRENIGEEDILKCLRPLLQAYANEKKENEHFGDYVIRAGYIQKVENGLDFHKNVPQYS